jgi:hypothetical protein
MQVGLLRCLESGEFYSRYLETAGMLGRFYGCVPHPRENTVVSTHDEWLTTVFRDMILKGVRERELWERSLETLTVALASRGCIVYAPRPATTVLEDQHNQKLLVRYPVAFTALQFARDRYMDEFLAAHNATSLGDYVGLGDIDLELVLKSVTNDPRNAANFIALLNLPPI